MKDYKSLARAVLDTRETMLAEWDHLAKRILPRRREVLARFKLAPASRKREHLASAAQSLITLASSYTSYITPPSTPWFDLVNRSTDAGDKHSVWLTAARDKMFDELGASNFYSEKMEADIDACLFGTGCSLCESPKDKRRSLLRFKHIPCGTFGMAENADTDIDTLCREFSYTAHQAVQRFGLDRLPNDVKDAYNDEKRRMTTTFSFWHLTCPRDEYVAPSGNDAISPELMPFASVYLCGFGNHEIVEEGGYMEFPYLVTRSLRWGDCAPWGYPPARACMDSLDGAIKIARTNDFLHDLQAFPRLLISAAMVGNVDMRQGGKTVIPEGTDPNLPREWASSGRLDISGEHLKQEEANIAAAFNVPFLNTVSLQERNMTAAEVYARQEEKVLNCTPSYTLYTWDLVPMLNRVFAILYRAGVFKNNSGAEPASIKELTADKQAYSIRAPKIAFHGKINQTIERAQQASLTYGVERIGEFVSVTGNSEMLDIIDMDALAKYYLDSCGSPSNIYRTDADVQALRSQRAQAAEAEMQLRLAQGDNQRAQAVRSLRG